MSPRRNKWQIHQSCAAASTHNPIRSLIENLRMEPNPDKSFIALSIGDPTIFGNLNPSHVAVRAMVKSVKSLKYNGYANSVGSEEAREAIASYSSTNNLKYTAKDIIMTSGCSGALESCITCLANPGQNILVPRPGFSIYRTIAESIGVNVKYYNLVPQNGWEVDLYHLEELIDNDTVAIVINNPSNPCGSVYSAHHLNEILSIASANYLPIISDEVYEYMVFEGETFIPLASLSEDVPVLTCSALTKRHLLPGWRVGWIKIHDPLDIFRKEIRSGLTALNQKTLGCNSIAQGALPTILNEVPEKFYRKTVSMIERHARLAYHELSQIRGLYPIMPQGAMYMMVGIDYSSFPSYPSETEFLEQLVKEESVFCLPGLCFNFPGYLRLVLTVPEDLIKEACKRISEFCYRHYIPSGNSLIKSAEIKKKNILFNNIKSENYGIMENRDQEIATI